MFYEFLSCTDAHPELADDIAFVAHHLHDVWDVVRADSILKNDYTFPAEIAPAAARLMRAIQAIKQCDARIAARVLNRECEHYGYMRQLTSENGYRVTFGDWSFHAFKKCAV